MCHGTLISNNGYTIDAEECLVECINVPDCNYFSYDDSLNMCALLEDCTDVDMECVDCVYGQRECGMGSKYGYANQLKLTIPL
jgi:hypothetical protein